MAITIRAFKGGKVMILASPSYTTKPAEAEWEGADDFPQFAEPTEVSIDELGHVIEMLTRNGKVNRDTALLLGEAGIDDGGDHTIN